jgi:hypothetical protein
MNVDENHLPCELKKTATRIKTMNFKGESYCYKLSPAFQGEEYVVISSVFAGGPETLMFSANSKGEVKNWMEMESCGEFSHDSLLSRLGYEIKSQESI